MAKKQKAEEQAKVGAAEVFAAFIDRLADNATITADVAGIIKHAINYNREKLEASVRAQE